MSINKRHVPSLKKVQEQYKEYGHKAFIKSWYKVEVFIGDSDGIQFIQDKLEGEFKKTVGRSA